VDDGERHHLRVRRAVDGERVALRDGAGLVGSGRLVIWGGEWVVEIDSVEQRPRPAPLTLAVGAGDRERFAWLVEKAVELGVTAIVPLDTERTAGVATRLRASHVDKLRRQALEALKQCGAAWTAHIEAPISVALLAERSGDGLAWVADPSGTAPPATLDRRPVTVVVGPEGGLSAAERSTLDAAGYRDMALAPHTLRFETAAVAAAAAVTVARLRGLHG
jgi:16S rRNA (uracil1498-N3)-methyltransferase